MKKIDTSFITTTAGLPVKSGVLNHLMQAYQEGLTALASILVGNNYDPTKVYILSGCVNSGSGLSYIFSAGYLYYAGEIFLMDAISFVATGSQVAVGNIVTTYATASNGDPIQFTDGSTHNVLQIRKIVPSAGLTGTGGLPDFTQWVQAASATVYRTLVSAWGSGYQVNFRQDQSVFFTTGAAAGTSTITWDFTDAIPGTVVRMKITAATGATVNVATPAGSNIYNLGGAVTQSKINFITAEYLGINELGNAEVTYSVISL